ncbi:hypothetical protein [Clostridium estertheticum]|uniref:Uncharacterized protein n=1 Tax=Clostridium estertheticum TaxID=238834 RepID=A0AA47EG63_9CLOT|nr:hypothetical protein [Clostridium estertheticum]MBU3156344.1 hypothetical protein [Clostridium estertheticum]WAG59611.1 hypothetical protein LL038_18545 [Clostridium estertheticum]
MINKGGRPKSYYDKELIIILEGYVEKHKDQKIVLSKLAKETGIARHIWDYSKKAKKLIEQLNNPLILTNKISSDLELIPSVESLLEQNANSPAKLRIAIETCLKVINSLKGKVNECSKLEKDNMVLETQLLESKNQNIKLKERIKNQEIVMLELCFDSESLKKRNEKGLKNNIIRIDEKSNIDKVIAVTEDDIIKEFPWLAD